MIFRGKVDRMKIKQQRTTPMPTIGSRSHDRYLMRQFDFFIKIPGTISAQLSPGGGSPHELNHHRF